MTKSITLQAVRVEIITAVNIHLLTRSRDDDSAETGISGNGCSVTFKRSTCPLPPDAFYYSQISKALNMLPVHLNSLSLVLYSDNPQWCHIECVAKEIWAKFEASQEKPFRVKKKKTLQAMVFLAMQEWKHYSQTGKSVHTPIKIQELLVTNEKNWHRDWSPFWQQLKEIICDEENRILEHVYYSTRTARMGGQDATAA